MIGLRLVPAVLAAGILAGIAAAGPGFGRLEGHGGPVHSVEVEGDRALTASFDYSVGLWDLGSGTVTWLEGHEAAVNDVLFLGEARAISAGDDFSLILWDLAAGQPIRRMEGHRGKVMDLAPGPAGLVASASWDGTIGLWDPATGAVQFLEAGTPVNAVAFTADGNGLWSAGHDGELRLWDLGTGSYRLIRGHGFGINVMILDQEAGWLVYGALDGGVFVLDVTSGAVLADLSADRQPVLAIARSPDGARVAIGDGEGYIHVVATEDWSTERDFHAVARGPVWGLAFSADGASLLSAGLDDFVTVWPLAEAVSLAETDLPHRFHAGEGLSNGARQFARKCSICHTLGPDGARRAGPTLYGLFGRRAGTVPGYAYSAALDGSEIVWNAETIDQLFDIGPDHYTPGSKMPMQRITGAQDRADLIAFLEEATRPEDQ